MIERYVFPYSTTSASGPGNPHLWGFEIEMRHSMLGRTSLDEWSTRRTELYLTTQNNCKRRTSMHPVGFEPTIPASKRPQTHAVDRTDEDIYTKFNIQREFSVIAQPRFFFPPLVLVLCGHPFRRFLCASLYVVLTPWWITVLNYNFNLSPSHSFISDLKYLKLIY